MQFLLETDDNVIEGAKGEISYRITETEKDGAKMPCLKIVLALNRFLTEITKIKCDLGTFCDTYLESISGGSSDHFVIYELISYKFSLNAPNIEALLLELNKSAFAESEGEDSE